MAAAACSTMNSQTLPPWPVESTQFGRDAEVLGQLDGGQRAGAAT